jgi:hypothetical protein
MLRVSAAAFAFLSLTLSAIAAGTPAPAPAPAPAAAKPAAPAAKPAAVKPDELWFVAKAADGAIGYNAKSIKGNAELGTVAIISLVYMKNGTKTKSGAPYHYVLSEDSVDCIGMQHQPKSRLVFDAKGALLDAGDAPKNAPWAPVPPNSPLSAFRSVACSNATFEGAKQAPNLTAAMAAMREIK